MPYILKAQQLETQANKTTVLDEQSTNEQYPSAKAVVEALENKQDKFATLMYDDNSSIEGAITGIKFDYPWISIVTGGGGVKDENGVYREGATLTLGEAFCDINQPLSVGEPLLDNDAATKGYVDKAVEGKQDKFANVEKVEIDSTAPRLSVEIPDEFVKFNAGDGGLNLDIDPVGIKLNELYVPKHRDVQLDSILDGSFDNWIATCGDIRSTAVGKTYFDTFSSSNGGIVFNDFTNNKAPAEYSIASGNNTRAGYTTHYIEKAEIIENDKQEPVSKLVLESTNGLEVGYVISIDGGNNFPYCATIEDIGWDMETDESYIIVNTVIKDHQGNILDLTKDEKFYLYVDGKPEIGNYRFGIGQTAGGINSQAISKGATAFGQGNYASGRYSVAMGKDNKASYCGVALGREGYAGFNATVSGYQSKASGNFSTTFGYRNESSGANSFSAGSNNIASGALSIAFGDNNKSQGRCSFTLGENVIASGYSSLAIGKSEKNKENPSHMASGDLSIAIGNDCEATGFGSVAIGWITKSSGQQSLAVGSQTTAKGSQSFAGGIGSVANGSRGFVFGKGLNSSSQTDCQTIFGTFNKYDNDALFIVGSGESGDERDRKNSLVLRKNGSLEIEYQGTNDNSVTTKGFVENLLNNLIGVGTDISQATSNNKFFVVID